MSLEQEFFSLAGTWLACRFDAIHGTGHGDLAFSLLGMVDHRLEIGLVVKEMAAMDQDEVCRLAAAFDPASEVAA